MKGKKRGVELQTRDYVLFRYLHAVKIATYDQIARDVYPEYSLASVGNRIRKLEDNKLIGSSCHRLLFHGKRTVFLLKSSFDAFVKTGEEYRIELRSDAPQHDLILVDIRSRFLQSKKTLKYQTENEIQTWNSEFRPINCDGLLTTQLGPAAVFIPIEYEGSMKKEERYEPLVKKYYQNEAFQLVAFVAENTQILQKVMNIEKEIFNWEKPKFFYRLMQDFLADEALRLENCHQVPLRLG